MEKTTRESASPSRLRRARDRDAPGIIALIERVFAEYPGNVLDVDREEPGLRTPASSYDGFWVLEHADRIVGCSACTIHRGGTAPSLELKKIYLDRTMRGQGWGRRLIEVAERVGERVGACRWFAWSDTRFETAHAVYEALGYRRTGRRRELHDLSRSTEIEFDKRSAPPPLPGAHGGA